MAVTATNHFKQLQLVP